MKLQDIKVKKKKPKATPEAINPAMSFETIDPVTSKLEESWHDYKSSSRALPAIKDKVNENLKKWFKEKWVRFGPDGKIRGECGGRSEGEGKPKCLPASKAHSLGKKGRASAAARKRREDPNPERSGAAINVATKKRTDEAHSEPYNPPRDAQGRSYLDSEPYNPPRDAQGRSYLEPAPYNPPRDAQGKSYLDFDPMQSQLDPSGKSYFDEGHQMCPECGGSMYPESMINEKKDACYYKVKSRYKVWPSAYASGALVRCRKKGAKSWGSKSKNESVDESQLDEKWSEKYKRSINCANPRGFSQRAHCQGRKKNEDQQLDEKCWDTHRQVGMKKKGSRMVPNCVPKEGAVNTNSKSKSMHEGGFDIPEIPRAPQPQPVKNKTSEDAIDDKLTAQYNTPAMKLQGQAVDKAFASGDQAEFDKLGILSPQQLERDYQAMLAKEPAQDAAVYADPKLTPSARKLPAQKYNPRGVPVKEDAPNFKSKQEVINYFVSKGKSAASGAAAWERGWRGPKQQKSLKTSKPHTKQQYWWQDQDLDEDTVTKNPSGTYTVSNAKKWNPDPETGTLSGRKRNIPGAIWDLAKQGMGFKSRYNTADIEADPRMKRHVKRYNDDDWIVIDPASNAFVSAAPRGTTHHRDLTLATAGTKPDYAKIPGIPLPPTLSPAFGGQPYVAIPGHVANFRRIAEAKDIYTEDSENPFVVYVNNKPIGKFDTPEEAKQMAMTIFKKIPRAYIDIRKTQCTDELIQKIAENENLYP